jgi:hypothetical protein
MQHKKARREYTGGEAPYGWRVAADGVSLRPNPTEQDVIRAATELRACGLSLRQIGRRLTTSGMLQRNGRAWHPQGVKVLLAAVAP